MKFKPLYNQTASSFCTVLLHIFPPPGKDWIFTWGWTHPYFLKRMVELCSLKQTHKHLLIEKKNSFLKFRENRVPKNQIDFFLLSLTHARYRNRFCCPCIIFFLMYSTGISLKNENFSFLFFAFYPLKLLFFTYNRAFLKK